MASYLGYPRIHFAGEYRADASTTNNDYCNYRMNEPLNPDIIDMDYDRYGTNELEIVNVKVMSVYYKDGTMSLRDSVVGQYIVGNIDCPLAKIVSSNNHLATLHGMEIGIHWSDNSPAFRGKWSPNIIGQSAWPRLKCYDLQHSLQSTHYPYSSQFTTTVTNIHWHDLRDSEVLNQLQNAVGEGTLALRGTMFHHPRDYLPSNDTYGNIIGVIGVPSPSDTLNVPGERAMYIKDRPVGLKFDRDDNCYGMDLSLFDPWTFVAPFEVDKTRNEVRLDLSNSLSVDMSYSIRNLGKLRLGILKNSCVYLLGQDSGLSYTRMEDIPINSGIYTIPVDPSLMHTVSSNPLVLAQVLDTQEGNTTICSESFLPLQFEQSVQILLQEELYYIRPTGLNKHFLDRHNRPESRDTVYVTKYGEPVQGLEVHTQRDYKSEYVVMYNATHAGVIPHSWSAITDEKGLAGFTFSINPSVTIPPFRHFTHPMCNFTGSRTTQTIPMDNQEYLFNYCVKVNPHVCKYHSYVSTYLIAFADVSFTHPYTWVKDVSPIFMLYARIAPAMKEILDLSSYNEVTKSDNLNLLNLTLRLDFDNPSYMPATRDLSPAKRKMILEWIEDPIYDVWIREPTTAIPSFNAPEITSSFVPPRCRASALLFQEAPYQHDAFFKEILTYSPYVAAEEKLPNLSVRPLGSKTCSMSELKRQLQTAIELEWVTIPVYLTSLYSIIDGYNTEIYHLIRTVIVQEMLHMVQAANILIAVNGSPLIDSPSTTPSYPVTGLPGGVLPSLKVSLEKLSLEHVYKVFMGIEVPQRSFVANPPILNEKRTIGAFYDEVTKCIEQFGDEIFNVSTVDLQVQWPWSMEKSVGKIIQVTSVVSALEAIDIITSQGEGEGILDPDEIGSNTLAHFYKFEEIVCQKHLDKVSDFHYAYSGPPIPFDPSGVWPMRSNPTVTTILSETSNCYIESRAFHGAYRRLLRKLQEIFSGHPEDIFIALEIMESLIIHAKRLMWTKYDSNNNTTCGPVWDYTWP